MRLPASAEQRKQQSEETTMNAPRTTNNSPNRERISRYIRNFKKIGNQKLNNPIVNWIKDMN